MHVGPNRATRCIVCYYHSSSFLSLTDSPTFYYYQSGLDYILFHSTFILNVHKSVHYFFFHMYVSVTYVTLLMYLACYVCSRPPHAGRPSFSDMVLETSYDYANKSVSVKYKDKVMTAL